MKLTTEVDAIRLEEDKLSFGDDRLFSLSLRKSSSWPELTGVSSLIKGNPPLQDTPLMAESSRGSKTPAERTILTITSLLVTVIKGHNHYLTANYLIK